MNGGLRGIAIACGSCALACNPPNIAGDPLTAPTTGEAFGGVKCSAVRPQTEPDLMAWDPGSRSNLNGLRRQGVVAVRYEAKGCNVELELLSHCIGNTEQYQFYTYSANEHKVAHNANELFAQLPVGAARFAGKVQGARALRTDYMMAGQYTLPAGATFSSKDLRGPDCARATHIVSAVYVGAFAMGSGETRAMDATASLLGASGGASSKADVEVLGDEGNADACRQSQDTGKESERCAVPLRIGLLALEDRSVPADTVPAPTVAQRPALPKPTAAPPPTSAPRTASNDRDGDGISDQLDACPDQVGVASSIPSQHGCPVSPAADLSTVDTQGRTDVLKKLQQLGNAQQTAQGVNATIQTSGLFLTGKVGLTPGGSQSFKDVGEAIHRGYANASITIEVHTDNQGDNKANVALAKGRADAVRDILVTGGVKSSQIQAVGVGPEKPIAANDTPEGRDKNRRVVIRIDNKK